MDAFGSITDDDAIAFALAKYHRRSRASWAVIPQNNRVTAVGDSITLASAAGTGGKTSSGTTARYQASTVDGANVGGYFTCACILPKTGDSFSDGPFIWSGVHATGGLTAGQILSTHINGADSPLNDSPKAAVAVVCAGSNDIGTISPAGSVVPANLATTLANIVAIWDALIAASILPVACKIPPSNTVNYQPAVTAINAALPALALSRNIPIVDFFTPCATANAWTTGYHNGDGIHPSLTGAMAMGQALRDVLEPIMPAWRPTLVTPSTEGDAVYQWMNGCYQRVSGTAGVPRGGAPAVEDTNPWTWTPNGSSPSLGARAGYLGNAWRNNLGGHASDTTAVTSGGAGVPPQYADGANFAVGFIAEIASWAASTGHQVDFYKQSDAAVTIHRYRIKTDGAYTTPVKPHVWYFENVIPASFGSNLRFAHSWGLGGTRVIDSYFGQFSLMKPT